MRYVKYGLLVLLLLQIPFFYRMCKTAQVEEYIQEASQGELRTEQLRSVPFQDLRGTIHVHSAAGGHSLGTYPEIIEAAKRADYRYLFITEHPKDYQLFNRLEDPELIMIYGWEREGRPQGHTLEDDESSVRIYTEFTGKIPEDVTGIEVYSLDENARKANTFFNWLSWIYHQAGYQELYFFHVWEIDRSRIELWDSELEDRQLPGFAGNDAHQNVGLVFQTTADQEIFSLMLDPYERSFRFVTNHLFLPAGVEVNRENVLSAIRKGSSYICFDQIGDPTGFGFYARVEGMPQSMGEVVPVGAEMVIQSPLLSRFSVIHSGETILELEGSYFEFEAEETGYYRVEVYPLGVPSLLRGKPWIISNPIYVSSPESSKNES